MDNPFKTPWVVSETPGEAPVLLDHDCDVVCVVRAQTPALAALLSLAPEMLRDLVDLVDVLRRFDDAYCRRHGLPAVTSDDLTAALADCLALLHYAHDVGLPLEIKP